MTTERKTVVLVAVVLAGLAGSSLWHGRRASAEILLSMAVTLVAAALASDAFARRFHRVWLRVGLLLGAFNTLALLALVYGVGCVACRCWGRLTKRDSLARRAPPQATYWIPRARTQSSHWQWERMY